MKIVNKFRFITFIAIVAIVLFGINELFFKKKNTDTVQQNMTEQPKTGATKKDSTNVVKPNDVVTHPSTSTTEGDKKENILPPKTDVTPPVVIIPITPNKEESVTEPEVKTGPVAPDTKKKTVIITPPNSKKSPGKKKQPIKNQRSRETDSVPVKKVLTVKFS